MVQSAGPMQVEKVLDDLIQRLSKSNSTAEVRAALIEARRLKNVTTRWAAIPPPPDARREMLSRVMDLVAKAGPAAIGLKPLGQESIAPPGASQPPAEKAASNRPAEEEVTIDERRSFRISAELAAAAQPRNTSDKPTARPPPTPRPPKLPSLELEEARAARRDANPPPAPAPSSPGTSPAAPLGDSRRAQTARDGKRVSLPPLPAEPFVADQKPPVPDLSAAQKYARKADTLGYAFDPSTAAKFGAGSTPPVVGTEAELAPSAPPAPPETTEGDPFAMPPAPPKRPAARAHTIAGVPEAHESALLTPQGLGAVLDRPPPKRKISTASLDVQQLLSGPQPDAGASPSSPPASVKPRTSTIPPQGGSRSITPAAGAPPPLRKPQVKGTLMMGSIAMTEALETARAEASRSTSDAPNPPAPTAPPEPPRSPPPQSPTPPAKKPSGARYPAVTPPAPAVRAAFAHREGGLEGFSSTVSTPSMTAVGPRPTPYPSSPTQIMGSSPPAASRSQAPPPDKPMRTPVAPGVTIVRPDVAAWQPHPAATGVTMKLLFRDPRSGVYTALLRLAPGAQLPRRRHVAAEEALLVSGLATVGGHEMRAGEYCRAESETIHEVISTTTGCTFFVCGSEHDEFLDEP